jgi:hypothetical protein
MTALCEGWDDYVMLRRGAAEPLWAVMSRVVDGAEIPVAAHGLALLIERVAAGAARGDRREVPISYGRLRMPHPCFTSRPSSGRRLRRLLRSLSKSARTPCGPS